MKNFKKQNLIEITQSEFQRYSSSHITEFEAFEIQQNLFGILELLINWSNNSIPENKFNKKESEV